VIISATAFCEHKVNMVCVCVCSFSALTDSTACHWSSVQAACVEEPHEEPRGGAT